jgi:hypothetical protein
VAKPNIPLHLTASGFRSALASGSGVHNLTVSVMATVDRCSGDEFMPKYCRVDESHKGNNKSATMSVSLP